MEKKKLMRTNGSESMVFGICGGLGKYFDIDPTIIRVLWAVITVVGFGSPILIYIIMAFLVPRESEKPV